MRSPRQIALHRIGALVYIGTFPSGSLADMTVSIHVPAALRGYCKGAKELRVSAASVRAALQELEQSHPPLYRSICDETGKVRRHVNLFVNTSHVGDREGLDTPLAAGDILTVLPAVSGG